MNHELETILNRVPVTHLSDVVRNTIYPDDARRYAARLLLTKYAAHPHLTSKLQHDAEFRMLIEQLSNTENILKVSNTELSDARQSKEIRTEPNELTKPCPWGNVLVHFF